MRKKLCLNVRISGKRSLDGRISPFFFSHMLPVLYSSSFSTNIYTLREKAYRESTLNLTQVIQWSILQFVCPYNECLLINQTRQNGWKLPKVILVLE